METVHLRIVLWDTRCSRCDGLAAADERPGECLVGRAYRGLHRAAFPLDRQPPVLELPYLAAILRRLKHAVEYAEDELPYGAAVYLMRPTLANLSEARAAIDRATVGQSNAQVLVFGPVAARWPQAFAGRCVKVVKGEIEQLLWHLDDVLTSPASVMHLGCVENLDLLPWPDWTCFEPRRFRLAGEFSAFPTGLIQQSRRTVLRAQDASAPAEPLDVNLRRRSAEHVVSEMRHGLETHGFASFRICDPLFGSDRRHALRLAELIGRLPRRIEFSVEGRPADLSEEVLLPLRTVGLTTVRFDYRDDFEPAREFVALTHRLGIRTLATFRLPAAAGSRDLKGVIRLAGQLDSTFVDYRRSLPVDAVASLEALNAPLPLGLLNRHYLRWSCLRRVVRNWLPQREDHLPERSTIAPQADAAHPATPRPLGSLDNLSMSGKLRKDEPHRRSPVRRSPGPGRVD